MSERGPYESKHEAAGRRIMDEVFPRLMALRSELQQAGCVPSGVMLPAHMDPGPYEGEDAQPEQSALLMGLPVTWGDRVALIVDA